MRNQLGQVFVKTEFRLSAIVWLFGYILVEIAAIAMGRSRPGEMFLANIPLLLTGIGLSVSLGWLLERLRSRPAYLQIAAMAGAGLLAGLTQTVADDLWLRAVSLTVMPEWQEWAVPFQPTRLFMILIIYLWTIYLVLALMWAARTSDHARMNEARAAAFEAAASPRITERMPGWNVARSPRGIAQRSAFRHRPAEQRHEDRDRGR